MRDWGFHPDDSVYGEKAMSDYPNSDHADLPLFANPSPPKTDDSPASEPPTLFLKDLPKPIPRGGLARESDPASSHVAASEVEEKISNLEAKFLAGLAELIAEPFAVVIEHNGKPLKLDCQTKWFTAKEVAAWVCSEDRTGETEPETIRKRASALFWPKGRLVKSEKICATTGKKVTAYGLPEGGAG